MNDETRPIEYTLITRNGHRQVEAEIIHEELVTIFINGEEFVTIMSTPSHQAALAVGFLANEGVINSLEDVPIAYVCKGGGCVDVWLSHSDFEPPRRTIITSGCGGGVTFDDLTENFPPLDVEASATPDQLWMMMDALNQSAELYSRARGVHTSAIGDGKNLLLVAEDVGRHNTLDKLRGMSLQQDIALRGHILISTGRVSSEMINKARMMETPIVCSRTSPTSLSMELADRWNITLIGYLRRNSMQVYTHPHRIILDESSVPEGQQKRESNA